MRGKRNVYISLFTIHIPNSTKSEESQSYIRVTLDLLNILPFVAAVSPSTLINAIISCCLSDS